MRRIDQSDFAGLAYEETTSGYRGTNGLSFADIDTDADLDLLITGFHGSKIFRITLRQSVNRLRVYVRHGLAYRHAWDGTVVG